VRPKPCQALDLVVNIFQVVVKIKPCTSIVQIAVVHVVCEVIILVTTIYSGVEYFAKNLDVFKDVK
jgi:hypothetical protein